MSAQPGPPSSFVAVEAGDVDHLLQGLVERGGLVDEGAEHLDRSLHDTFDWRLWKAGTVLELERPDGRGTAATVTWHDLAGSAVHARYELGAVPPMVESLPPGPATDRIAALVEMRALLPLVELHTTRHVLARIDAEGKRRGRIVVERSRLRDGTALPVRLEVVALRGYERDARRLSELLAAQVGLTPTDTDAVEDAYVAACLVPGSYSSKLSLSFPPAPTALDAWRTVLGTLAATMDDNLPGTRADTDSEFLHDYRVAVRRTRSILATGRGVLADDVLARFRDEFKWLGAVTTPVRDLDVWLLDLPGLVADLDPAHQGDLAPLGDLLRRRQVAAHRELVGALDSERAIGLRLDWHALLDDPDRLAGPDAGTPATLVAAERIWRTHRRLLRDGRAIDDASPPEALHELRKDGKKLRYLLECFGPLFPADRVAPIVKELKALQDVLGTFQDTEVQAGSLRTFGQELLDQRKGNADTLIAMGHLVDRITARQHAARAAFAERFARFDSSRNREHVRDLFGPEARGAVASDGTGTDTTSEGDA